MGRANRHRRAERPVALARLTAGTALVSAALNLAWAPHSVAVSGDAGEGERTAVVGPLLDLFYFGATIGIPLVCDTTAGTVGSGFQEFGASDPGNQAAGPVLQGCAVFSEQGGAFVEQGKVAQAPFAAQFNPVANPVVAQLGTAVTEFGTTYDAALAPFGETVTGFGATIGFLQGSTPDSP